MVKSSEDMLIRFERMYERDGHTETDRQTPHDGKGHACKASRGKNWSSVFLKQVHNDNLFYI